jgi:hypothetical protein
MRDAGEERSPILGSWTAVYALIVGVLLALGVFFYLFTKHFE